MIARRTITAIAAAVCLAAAGASVANADFGDDFGFTQINQTGEPTAPAFPDTEAIWSGTCDLGSSSTANGGVGAAPAIRAHCIDTDEAVGRQNGDDGSPWPLGEEPEWRLDPVTQAGAHPDASASFWFEYETTSGVAPEGSVKNIIVNLPPGVVGSPEAVPKCPAAAVQSVPPGCVPENQVGINSIGFMNTVPLPSYLQTFPVYAVEARDTVTAEFTIAYVAEFFNVPITARGRTNGDYGVDTLALLIPDFVLLGGQSITFWGVPWAQEHDKFRAGGAELKALENGGFVGKHATGYPAEVQQSYDSSWGPIKPFFTNPTECSGQKLATTINMDSWQNPSSLGGEMVVGTTEADLVTGCEKLEFDPQITLRPTVDVSDSPSGLVVKLETPQHNDPPASIPGNPDLAHDPDDSNGAPAYWRSDAGLASAHLKDTTVQLPAGTSFNPAAANGLQGCSTAQIGLTATEPKVTFNNDKVRCPESAKLGTLEIVSPLLPDPLFGDVYAAPQHDNPFPGSLTAIYMVAQDDERGLSIKLPGKVDLDPATGQISTTFLDNPQLPFETFELHFKSGPRAPLNTPPVCGQFKNQIDLSPWSHPHSGPIASIADPFDIKAMASALPCVTEPEDRLHTPGFNAGSTVTQAGSHTGFALNVARSDGYQEVSALSLQMPRGLTAKLAGVPYCPDATLAAIERRSGSQETQAPACPPASRIGSVNSLAGAGPLPLPTAGSLYFAGPHAGAPLSIAAVVPAIAGGLPGAPAFDLGNVVIRSALHVDPQSATVTVASTRLPYILGGVPLRIRHISVDIDKPGFMLNPTNCEPMAIHSGIGGAADPLDPADDTLAGPHSPFQVGNCAALAFKPKLGLRFFGKTHRGANQRLRAVLRARSGDANIRRAAVTLPASAFLDQQNIRTICTRVQFAAGACPKGSVYGHATAYSPLVDYPLSGPVYLRSSDNTLPDMVADLHGPAHQPLRIELVGRIDSVKRGIRSTFEAVPDAPVSRFVLNMFGGKRSLIENSRNLCKNPGRATVRFGAQNGRREGFRPVVSNPRCKKQRKGAAKKGKRAGHRTKRGERRRGRG